MDLEKIKAKLAQLNDENAGRTDNSDKFWKVPNGDTQIRIIPSKYNPNDPFTELKFHNTLSKFPILALSNFGEQDPVEQLIEKLRETSDKENWSLSGKISPRPRYFVPIIVRGEEDKGVRIWSISSGVYKALLTLAADDEIGDFTDIVNGTDMVVTKTPPASPGAYAEISVRARRNSSPLSKDENQIKEWLENQPKPIDLFRKPDYNYTKKQLENYLNGKATTGPAVPSGDEKEDESKSKDGDFQLKAKDVKVEQPKQPAKKVSTKESTASKFDDLFGDEGDTDPAGSAEGTNDKFPWEK